MEEVTKFKTIGKYPPAFGLMGTTLSMITLLQRLGEPGGQKLIGPAMALGLVATFYGLALSNLVFGPMAESLADNARETKLKNTIIVEGVRLIMAKTNPIVLAEELNSFLMPSERIDWKTLQGRGSAAAPGEARAA
jgi:chemotaxis protein MotA